MAKALQGWFEEFPPRVRLRRIRARLSNRLLSARRLMLATKAYTLKAVGAGAPSVSARDEMGRALQEECESLWKNGDPWDLAGSEYEQKKYIRQLELLGDRRYQSVLEIGSANACFSRMVSRIAGKVLALDISESAIARARETCVGFPNIEFRVANIMDFDVAAEGPFDLIVLSETIYYLVVAYGADDVASQVKRLYAATKEGGSMLMANGLLKHERRTGEASTATTYRDIVLQCGFKLEREEIFWHTRDGERHGALMGVFRKP